jgi:hypothetical protein
MAKVDVLEVARGSVGRKIASFTLENEQEVEKFVARFNKINVPTDSSLRARGKYMMASSQSRGGIY